MDILHQGVITLLKNGITGEKTPLPEGFELEKALPCLKAHGVLSLGYLGARLSGISSKDPAAAELFRCYCRNTVVSEAQIRAIQGIYQAFDEAKVDYMPVKGCNLKFLYPQPECRMMGDADILIRLEQYDRIRRIMQELGYEEGQETDHELVWKSRSLYVELHKRLIPSYNKDYFRYYGDGWKLAARAEGTHYYMTPEDQFIYVFTHFAKHYRDGGIGCRQVLDLWICRRTYPDMDRDYISRELDRLGLLEFYRNMEAVLGVWFGGEPENPKTELITEYIMNSGNWGSLQQHNLSNAVKRADAMHSVSAGRTGWMLRLVFPNLETMSVIYPCLRKMPILLPFFWVRKWFGILFLRPDHIFRKIKQARNLSDENISEFQRSLNAVGLNFRFDEEKG